MSHTLLILKIYTTFKDVQMMLKIDISTGFRFSKISVECSVHLCSCPWFIELQFQYMKIPSSNLWRTCCVQKLFLTFRTIFVHNMLSPCFSKRRASDLPVLRYIVQIVYRLILMSCYLLHSFLYAY